MMRFAVLPLLVLMSSNVSFGQERPGGLLEQGIQTYQQAIGTKDRNHRVQLFGRAQTIFARLIQEQANEPVGAALYMNLGNAALGAEDLGQAVLAYRRALLIEPKNSRALQNLRHARSLLPDWIPKPEESISFGSFFDWAKVMRPADWLGLAALTFLIALILLAIYVRTDSVAIRNVGIIIACIWLVLLIRGLTATDSTDRPIAVVVATEVTARSADSINAPARFPQPLVGGSELRIITDRDDWLRIQLFDGREGWLPRSAIASL